MAKLALADVSPGNQWVSAVLLAAIDEAAKEDQRQTALNGRIVRLDVLRQVVAMRWLDAMMPAGNG